MRELTGAEKHILEQHNLWLSDYVLGECANLSKADLRGANLHWAGLSKANLSKANLSWANLSKADLRGADLRGADLRVADLREADLRGANLSKADLRGADLREANLSKADLSKADLSWADLSKADLSQATGLLSQREWLDSNMVMRDGMIVAYKIQAHIADYCWPTSWVWEPDAIFTENVNADRCNNCACGVNVATLEWCQRNTPGDCAIWEVLVDPRGVVVPYGTDGKFRAERVKLGRVVNKEEAE